MYTTLAAAQELIAVELRKLLLLPNDDLLAVTRAFMNPAVSRAGLGRCLRRHGVADRRELVVQVGAHLSIRKTFKDYEPGFLHTDIKYLPQMPDEKARRYLFGAIDRASPFGRAVRKQTGWLNAPMDASATISFSPTRFGSAAELESTLRNFVKGYNHNIPAGVRHQTAIQALKAGTRESAIR